MKPDRIETKLFRQAHLDWFKTTPEKRKDCYEMAKWMEVLGFEGQCGTHSIDGRLLYISSWFTVAPGVVEVFILPSIYVKQYARDFYVHVKWWLGYLWTLTGARRIQTWGEDTELSKRWLAKLGFSLEGTLNGYRPDGGPMYIWGMAWQAQ